MYPVIRRMKLYVWTRWCTNTCSRPRFQPFGQDGWVMGQFSVQPFQRPPSTVHSLPSVLMGRQSRPFTPHGCACFPARGGDQRMWHGVDGLQNSKRLLPSPPQSVPAPSLRSGDPQSGAAGDSQAGVPVSWSVLVLWGKSPRVHAGKRAESQEDGA